MHRGDIIECSYARHDYPAGARSSRSSLELPRNAQSRLDHLERLVVSLVDEKRASEQVATPATTNTSSRIAEHDLPPAVDAAYESTGGQLRATGGESNILSTNLCPGSSDLRWSVDEARWAALLNGVRLSPLPSQRETHHQC